MCVCVYKVEYYLAMRKGEALPFSRMWMRLEGFMLTEINQTV